MFGSRVVLAVLVLAVPACGGQVGHSPPTEESCAFIPVQRRDDDPCMLYCEAYRSCASCEPVVISACRTSCEETLSRDAAKRDCLACAVEHLEAVAGDLSCDAPFDANASAPTFTLVYDTTVCGSACASTP